jgi:hypothetical protein
MLLFDNFLQCKASEAQKRYGDKTKAAKKEPRIAGREKAVALPMAANQ